VSKAIDRAAGAERAPGRTLVTDGTRGNTPNAPANATCADCGRPKWGKDYCQCPRDGGPATPEAQQWEGWGTALKPALEPITVARKPFKGNVAANVLEHGTGAININECRVGAEILPAQVRGVAAPRWVTAVAGAITPERVGRWPANLIHDGSDEVVGLFPARRSSGAIRVTHHESGNQTNTSANCCYRAPSNDATTPAAPPASSTAPRPARPTATKATPIPRSNPPT
jgi:hypothetical protein